MFEDDIEGNGICLITQPGVTDIALKGIEREDGLYEVDICPQNNIHVANVALSMEEKQELWHARLGHASKKVIEIAIPIVDGIDIKAIKIEKSEPCIKGKSKRDTRPSVVEPQANRPLELVHSDIIGPVRNTYLGVSSYCIPLYDDFSGLSLVRFSKTKHAAAEALKDMILELEATCQANVGRLSVTRLRTENAKEFISKDFKSWLKEKGIQQELSYPYSPESNGKAERLNRTLVDTARTLMVGISHLKGHEQLWAEAIHTAIFLRNRMYTSACCVHGKTPYEVIIGKKPNFSHIRRFGAVAYVHVPKERRKIKFQERATVSVRVGCHHGNSYKV